MCLKKMKCDCCGSTDHNRDKCRFRNERYFSCGTVGHAKRVCDERLKTYGICGKEGHAEVACWRKTKKSEIKHQKDEVDNFIVDDVQEVKEKLEEDLKVHEALEAEEKNVKMKEGDLVIIDLEVGSEEWRMLKKLLVILDFTEFPRLLTFRSREKKSRSS